MLVLYEYERALQAYTTLLAVYCYRYCIPMTIIFILLALSLMLEAFRKKLLRATRNTAAAAISHPQSANVFTQSLQGQSALETCVAGCGAASDHTAGHKHHQVAFRQLAAPLLHL